MGWVQIFPRQYNKGNDFGIALANYFIFKNDLDAAKRVAQNYDQHPFVHNDGTNNIDSIAATAVLRDLTAGKYTGILKYRRMPFDKKGLPNLIGEENAAKEMQALKKEKQDGRLQGGLSEFSYRGSALLLQSLPHPANYNRWIVDCDHWRTISDGDELVVKNKKLFLSTVQAVLTIYDASKN